MASITNQKLSAICQRLDNLAVAASSDNSEVVACLTDIKGLLTTLTGTVEEKIDYSFKVLSRQCYECPDGSQYTEVLCAKYQDEIFIENVLQYIVGTEVLSTPPCVGVPCIEGSFETIKIDVCFEDCTSGYSLVKINTSTDEVTTIGTYNLDGSTSNLAVVECPEYKVIDTLICN